MTKNAIETLISELPKSNLVWGGDGNHSLKGSEVAGSNGGREHLSNAVQSLNLQVVTTDKPHQIEGCFTIDHIAIPISWAVINSSTKQIAAKGLSDHNAYVVEVVPN